MKKITCLQYCINGMNEGLLEFTSTENGKFLVSEYKQWNVSLKNQIKEILIAYFNCFLVQAIIQMQGMPKHPSSVEQVMSSKVFDELHEEIDQVVSDNYGLLMSRLSTKQKLRLEALFK